LVFAYIVGAVGGVILLITKKKTLNSSTPFGTYLAMGTLVAMLWGTHIVNWYMKFLR
jgi:leader peptidase (prepilin peptidase)/N-methyltransferase